MKKSPRLTIDQVNQEKRSVFAELKSVEDQSGRAARLKHILVQINQLDETAAPQELLRRFIFVVSALVHQDRHGGLSKKQINNLADLGFAILQLLRLQPQKSKLSFLYKELHLGISQVARKQGNAWQAAWYQQLSDYVSDVKHGDDDWQLLAMGIRAIRLGHGGVAEDCFQRVCESPKINGATKCKARIHHIKTLRLRGKLAQAAALVHATVDDPLYKDIDLAELNWEAWGCQVAGEKDPNLSVMAKHTKKNGTHDAGTYVVEAMYYAYSVSSTAWMCRFPKASYLARGRRFAVQPLGGFFAGIKAIEECYDVDIPIIVRLHGLGKALEQSSSLLTIDRELLLWAAASRWLARAHLFTMATMTLSQYRGISLKLSSGSSSDVLGLCQDLMDKPWFVEDSSVAPSQIVLSKAN